MKLNGHTVIMPRPLSLSDMSTEYLSTMDSVIKVTRHDELAPKTERWQRSELPAAQQVKTGSRPYSQHDCNCLSPFSGAIFLATEMRTHVTNARQLTLKTPGMAKQGHEQNKLEGAPGNCYGPL